MKRQILNIVEKHKKAFSCLSRAANALNPRNTLHKKGVSLSCEGIVMINGLRIHARGEDNRILIKDMTRLSGCKIFIHGDHNRIMIGSKCLLRDISFIIEDGNNAISIGNNTLLCGQADLSAIEGTRIEIGNDCLLSGELHFRTGDSHSILDENGQRINPSRDIIIKDHVWIGTKATILKGVYVERNCIIGATSTLVTKYDKPNCVIAGVPARIVKENVDWTSKRV